MQTLRNGIKELVEVPDLVPSPLEIIVETNFSCISLGTEMSTIKAAKASMLGKLKERPDQALNVLNVAKTYGLSYAVNAVDKKLGSLSPLGYSTAGQVVAVGLDVKEFRVGDFVACGGIGVAVHGTQNAVPINQAVRLDSDSDLKIASLNSLGAIVLEALRLANYSPGVKICVLGYGPLGQLAATLCEASGAEVCVVDTKSDLKSRATILGHRFFEFSSTVPTVESIKSTPGWEYGADIVLICAATKSNQPINTAGEICRQRGEVVIVGDVGTAFRRNPDFYRKEIRLMISCSYGAGRYDPQYEDEGIDYPYGLVRWTSKRNMEAFHLISQRNVSIFRRLIASITPFDDLIETYENLEKKGSDGFVLVEYGSRDRRAEAVSFGSVPSTGRHASAAGTYSVGILGPGAFCQGTILPILRRHRVNMTTVFSKTGLTALRVQRKYKFDRICESMEQMFQDDGVDLIFCTMRHDLHFECIKLAAEYGKKVFLEKPLCTTIDQFEELSKMHAEGTFFDDQITLGYNRTFSPTYKVFKREAAGSRLIHYEVNAGSLPSDSWQLGAAGGGRIVGEVCHFVALCCDFFDAPVNRVSVTHVSGASRGHHSYLITLLFEPDKVATIHYVAAGYTGGPKETVIARASDTTVSLEDFRVIKKNGKIIKRTWTADKGHHAMVEAVLESRASESKISDFSHLLHVSRVTFVIEQAANCNTVLTI